jgi:hypothetical protein
VYNERRNISESETDSAFCTFFPKDLGLFRSSIKKHIKQRNLNKSKRFDTYLFTNLVHVGKLFIRALNAITSRRLGLGLDCLGSRSGGCFGAGLGGIRRRRLVWFQ